VKSWTRPLVVAAGGIAGSVAAAVAVGSRLWDRSIARAVEQLAFHAAASPSAFFSREHLQGLPEPVARYFEFALTPGQPLIKTARVEHRGEMRLGGFGAPWRPFTSVQHVSTHPPGFVWDATFSMAPFVSIRVRDSYLDGVGAMQGKLAGLIPVVDQSGRPELAAAALHRYLAEAVWFPTALLPGDGLTWEAIDSTRARAVLTDHGITVSLEFLFAPNGSIERASTPARYRERNGAYVPTPWACNYRSYEAVDGMRVPMGGEVAWILPEGRLSVWRGRIRRIDYAFGPGKLQEYDRPAGGLRAGDHRRGFEPE
jgi:hypothetical protein